MAGDELRAVFLLGPTASGKTDLAMRLPERLPERLGCEIVSVDSVQIYRGLDIGSAKPDADLLRRCPHHLIDILEPTEAYSAARFCDDAEALVRDINARGGLPLLSGGTMFYFHAFEYGLDALPSGDAELRREIDALCEAHGVGFLYERLCELDRDAARRIKPTDTQRIKRALEVHRLCDAPMSALQSGRRRTRPDMRLCKLAVEWGDRAELHRRIERRFTAMLDAGLRDEVCGLMLRGDMRPDGPAMRTAGYRQMWSHLDGRLSHDEMVAKSLSAHRQLAKRQLTWMRSMSDLNRYEMGGADMDAVADAMGEQIRRSLELV